MTEWRNPEPLAASRTLQAIEDAGVTHVVTVPDTYQRTLLGAIERRETPQMILSCTEDEAFCINTGLYITGWRPLLSIQNNGLYAGLNALKGAMECDVPTAMLIGQYGHVADCPPRESRLRQVRMLEPTLDAWEIPFVRLDCNEDLPCIPERYEEAMQDGKTIAFVIGTAMVD